MVGTSPRRVLVTGGTGFLGTAIVAAIANDGAAVRIASRTRPTRLPAKAEWIPFDLAAPGNDWQRLLDGCETVYHLAWSTIPKTSSLDPVADARTNVAGSVALIEAVRNAAPRPRLVFASSGGTVYGQPPAIPIVETARLQPISAYGAAKAAVETYCRANSFAYGQDIRIARIGNLYGPGQPTTTGQGAITAFIVRALARQPIEFWGDGGAVRDYVFVADVVEALRAIAAIPAEAIGQDEPVFNIGSGTGTSLRDIVVSIEAILGRTLAIDHLPGRQFDVSRNILDTTRARRVLGWSARTPLTEGIRKSIEAWGRP